MSGENSRSEAISEAIEEGLKVAYADSTTLQLDLDSAEDLRFAKEMLKKFMSLVNFSTATQTVSRSSRWHIYVNLKKPMPLTRRIAYQAFLGSDRKREILNYDQAVKFKHATPTTNEPFLFEKEGAEHTLLNFHK